MSSPHRVLLLLGALLSLLVIGPHAVRADDGGVAPDAATSGGSEPPDEAEAPLPRGHQPEVQLEVTPRDGLMTGDLIQVRITAKVPEGDDVAIPRQSFGSLELHAQRHRDRALPDGTRELSFELDLLALEPGETEIPPLRLRVVTRDGVVGSTRTQAVRLTVGSLLANEPDAQPKPASAPVMVMEDDQRPMYVLLALVALAVTVLGTWLFFRWWSKRAKKAAPLPPPRPPWEIALAKLEAVKGEQARLLETGAHVELVDRTSDAVREYLGARYGFNGLESTTDEIVARLRDARVAGASVPEITAFLSECDLVKFARAVPTADEAHRLVQGGIGIVRATIPRVESSAISPPAPSVVRSQPAGVPLQSKTLHLSVDRPELLDPVISASVIGAASTSVDDPTWSGALRVHLDAQLADSPAVREQLSELVARLSERLQGRRTFHGASVTLAICHFYDATNPKLCARYGADEAPIEGAR